MVSWVKFGQKLLNEWFRNIELIGNTCIMQTESYEFHGFKL